MLFLAIGLLLGVQYTSKLDEFEDFVEKIRKYGLITQFYSGKSTSSVMLLIDDLPETNGRIAFERLKKCLELLVSSIQIPTALVVTGYSKVDPGDSTARRFEELELSLENAGAYKVVFLNRFYHVPKIMLLQMLI